jgi:di- and tripeptidase
VDEGNGPLSRDGQCLHFSRANYTPFAHRAHVYAMLLVKGAFHHDPEEELLISGGGDGTIKLWSIDNLEKEGLMLLDKFKNEGLGVLSMAYSDTFLYVGFTNAKVHVYSLDSMQLVHRLEVRCGDIGAIEVIGGKTFCGGSGGYIKVLQSVLFILKHN